MTSKRWWRPADSSPCKVDTSDPMRGSGAPNTTSFTRAVKLKEGETVVFSWITYKSRAHRDAVNKTVMADPRLKNMMDPANSPFDMKRRIYGGFKTMMEL